MNGEPLLDEKEMNVLNLLARAFNGFVELEVLHPSDREEFARAVHAAQNIVLARPAMREIGLGPTAEEE